ncbi:unnamed protein product (macronuclear) [Paramecium tetraurelia]|uniref:Uncharacterized protein n=1 Tax=Paramecium tetraurelia TaxID=5888 RepID=A0CNC7_PARTE|nr:uncharacterized protein GSPATT00008736001 [Paramecium tetraurelia]CAK72294.1 unnamed protein product [Paramecium tetraurelia]|eukprot:XP_001439691.1 hypothetical protein (macronuclear) [Paramecium tetraurelia strain d4-2]
MNQLRNQRGTDTDEVYIDPERGIAINARQMTTEQHFKYYKSSFSTLRPDLTEYEYEAFAKRLRVGESFLNHMRAFLNHESGRVTNLYPVSARLEKILNYQNQYFHLRPPFILGHRSNANRNWADASKVVNYVEKQLLKITKYGLDYPNYYAPSTENELKQREDEIYERFVREMRKPPVAAAQ